MISTLNDLNANLCSMSAAEYLAYLNSLTEIKDIYSGTKRLSQLSLHPDILQSPLLMQIYEKRMSLAERLSSLGDEWSPKTRYVQFNERTFEYFLLRAKTPAELENFKNYFSRVSCSTVYYSLFISDLTQIDKMKKFKILNSLSLPEIHISTPSLIESYISDKQYAEFIKKFKKNKKYYLANFEQTMTNLIRKNQDFDDIKISAFNDFLTRNSITDKGLKILQWVSKKNYNKDNEEYNWSEKFSDYTNSMKEKESFAKMIVSKKTGTINKL